MARILGIIGSSRRWGNSELLVRQAMLGAQEEGAEIQMLRLTSLQLDSCQGCLRCVIGQKPCRIVDDMAWLADTISGADALVLAAPTYFLGPAAVVKLALDRLLMVSGQIDAPSLPPRPALTIATAGLQEWRGVTLPYLNALVSAFGYEPIDSLTAIAPGPGEVLLDEGLMERVGQAGRRLGRGEQKRTPAPPNTCPICHCDSFLIEGLRAVCPICSQEAAIVQTVDGMQLIFDEMPGTDQRWTPEGLRKHMVDWVMATGPRYMANRSEIKARRLPYRRMDAGWLCPPGLDETP